MSGGHNDELASVRIEVEATGGALHAPDVLVTTEEKPSKWLLVIAGAAVIVVLAVAFFGVRPAGDEAADGTIREVPVQPTSTPTPTSIAEQQPSPTIVNDENRRRDSVVVDEPAISVRVASPRRIEQIVSTSGGFVALPDVESTVVPQILFSSNGLSWLEIETQRVETSNADEPADWFSLLVGDDGLTVLGSSVQRAGALDVLTSPFGQTWELVADLGPVDDPGRRVVPVASFGDRIVALELFEELELEPFLGQFVETRNLGVCSAYEAGPDNFSLSDCADFSVASDPPISQRVEVVEPDCDAVAVSGGRPGFALLQLELDGATGARELPTVSFVSGDFFPRFGMLSSGRVGVFDVGNSAFPRCDGSGVFRARDAGVVVVDVEQNRTFGYPAPDEVAIDIRDRFDKEILGEVQLFGDRTHLVVSVRGSIWAIDTLSGEWTMLTEGVRAAGFQTPFAPEFAPSADDAGRFFQVANGAITIVELGVGEGAMLRAVETIVPIANDAADQVRLGFGSILHATNEFIFYTDGITIWRLEIPVEATS